MKQEFCIPPPPTAKPLDLYILLQSTSPPPPKKKYIYILGKTLTPLHSPLQPEKFQISNKLPYYNIIKVLSFSLH